MSDPLNMFVRGKVIHRLRNKGLEGLKVEAFDHPSGSPVEIGEATSGPSGVFEIEVPNAVARDLLTEGRGLSFKVSDDTTLLLETTPGVWDPSRAGIDVSLFVGTVPEEVISEEVTAPQMKGRVRYEDGRGAAGALVWLRHYAELGADVVDLAAAVVDTQGAFSLYYALPTGSTKDAGEPLLRLVVEIDEEEVASSTLLKSVPAKFSVEVTIPQAAPSQPNAISDLISKLDPILGERELKTLDPVEVGALASTVGVSRGEVESAVAADKLTAKLSAEGGTMERPVVHALTKRGLPGDTLAFALTSNARVQEAWGKAVKDGDLTSGDVPDDVDAFLALAVKAGAKQALGTTLAPGFLRTVLPTTLSEDQRTVVAETWIAKARDGQLSGLWDALEDHDDFSGTTEKEEEFDKVKHTFQVGEVTDWNLPVLQKIRSVTTTVEDMAGRKQDWWVGHLGDIVDPNLSWVPSKFTGTDEERIAAYAASVRKRVDEALPTAHMKRYVDENSGLSEGVKDFFTNEDFEDFDIRYDRVDEYLAEKDPTGDVVEADRETLKTLQRLSRVTKDSDVLDAFQTLGLKSAMDIATIPDEEYRSAIQALVTDEKAIGDARKTAIMQSVMGVGLGAKSTTQAVQALKVFEPNSVEVQELFGAILGCECDECSSVLSPAAYLAELAAYLKDAFEVSGDADDAWEFITEPAGTAAFARMRREDLPAAPLSCAATRTPMPHIDLVNELLERLVPVGAAPAFRRTATNSPVSAELDPSSASTATAMPDPQRPDATAEELGAYPQDTWYPAHRLLAGTQTRAAFTLPFDRPTVEARLYLEDAEFPLSRLLQLRVAASTDAYPVTTPAWDRLSALEAIGFTSAEAVPFEAYPIGDFDGASAWVHGSGDGRYGADLGATTTGQVLVAGLMRRLGLTWDELGRVCGSAFVKRFCVVELPDLPATCDLEGLTTVSLGASVPLPEGDPTGNEGRRNLLLEGMHRFVRLQRRLGWTFEEVDIALNLFLVGASIPARIFGLTVWSGLAETQTLVREFGFEPIEALALWPSESAPHPFLASMPKGSLWERTFERRTSRHPNDKLFADIRLNGGVPSAGSPRELTEVEKRSVASALGLRSREFAALAAYPETEPLLAHQTKLWSLWARARIARSSGLPFEDACWLLNTLMEDYHYDPTSADGTHRVREFFHAARVLRASKISAGDLAYLVGNDKTSRTTMRMKEDRARSALESLRTDLRGVVDATVSFPWEMADGPIESALPDLLSRFMTREAAIRTVAYLNDSAEFTEVDPRVPFLEEVLGRGLWSHEIEDLFGITVVADRRRFVHNHFNRLSLLPDLPMPPVRMRRLLNNHDVGGSDPARYGASTFITATLLPVIGDELAEELPDFLGRLDSTAALDSADEAVCDAAFGAGYYDDLASLAHGSGPQREARMDSVVRLCVMRELFASLPPVSEEPLEYDPLTTVLAALNRPVDLDDSSQGDAKDFLERVIFGPMWSLVREHAAGTAAEREERREFVLIALDGLRAGLTLDAVSVAQVALQSLVEATFPPPLTDAPYAQSLAQGLMNNNMYGFAAFLVSDVPPAPLAPLGLAEELVESMASAFSASMSSIESTKAAAAWLPRLVFHFRERLREIALPNTLASRLADALGISRERCEALLDPDQIGVLSTSGGIPVSAAFLMSWFITSVGVIDPNDVLRFERLWKASRLLLQFDLSDAELADYNAWADRGLIDLRTLPTGDPPSTIDPVAGAMAVIHTLEALSFRSLVQSEDETVFDLLTAIGSISGATEDVDDDIVRIQTISDLTGWPNIHQPEASTPRPDPFFAATFGGGTPGYLKVSRRLRRRLAAESAASTLGVSVEKVMAWAGEFTATDADPFTRRLTATQGVREALRAQHGDQGWNKRSRPLIDRLREQQRDALADYHCARNAFDDRNDLFGWLLVDTEMSCCMDTTRTLFATASLQTMIQRSFMGLEPAVTPKDGYAARWQWMKQYRVWEANRKVFLFPENWLEPSLRRDKTPLFAAFEDTLQQSELSDETINKALGSYLSGLDRIARLDVRAFTVEEHHDAAGGASLHVVARTFAAPYEYYYRRRVRGMRWTPWEKIDVQIKGNSHTLAMVNKRPHLFWAEVSGEAEDPQRTQAANTRNVRTPTDDPPRRQPDPGISIRIAFSRLENGAWTPARVSKEEQRIEWDQSWAASMQREWDQCRDQLGRNVSLRVVSMGEDDRIAANVCVMHSAYEYPDDTERPLLSSHRATFVLRRCTGELERLPHDPLPLPATSVRFAQGVPVSSYTESHAAYYPADDALETWDDQTIPVTVIANSRIGSDISAPIAVMKVPVQFVPAFTAGLRHPYQYRLRVDHSRVRMGAEVEPLDELRPMVLTDGVRSFLIERDNCQSCSDSNTVESPKATGGVYVFTGLFGPFSSAGDFGQVKSGDGKGISIVGKNDGAIVKDNANAPVEGVTFKTTAVPDDTLRLHISGLYHAQSCRLLEQLDKDGPAGLFSLNTQFPIYIPNRTDHQILPVTLNGTYEFNVPADEAPSDDFDFSPGSAYGLYNWEVFFHAPFRIACMLNEDQQFERAQTWFHYIFDPFTVGAAVPHELRDVTLEGDGTLRRCWRFRPFFVAETGGNGNDLRALLDPRDNGPVAIRARRRIAEQIYTWLENPFDPYAIATFRERSFQIAVVFRYIDNLLDWGDSLFQRGTRETVIEATQIYVLAAELLGQRPQQIRRPGGSGAPTDLGEALAPSPSPKGEDFAGDAIACCHSIPDDASEVLAALGRLSQFCSPSNDQLLGYWDRVADRLFKIRHCLDIDGVPRKLPLFEPPIDPALLIRAAAAGVDIGAALADSAPSLPTFRFQTLLQRAIEFTGDVRNLGSQLLAALEKRDAEAISRLRTGHEQAMLEATRAVRTLQVQEAQAQIEGLTESKALAQARAEYYDGKPFMNALEGSALAATATSIALQIASQALSTTAAAAAASPDAIAGGAGIASPVALFMTGGKKVADSSSNAGAALSLGASIASTTASTLATLGGYTQRQEDWHFQRDQAVREQGQIDRQITAATLRQAIAERESSNLSLQIANARQVDEEMRSKFTNTELYEWMARQVSSIYFRSYQMALELAQRAERAYRFERLDPSARFLSASSSYWDTRKRGLTAGETLHHDLRRMEKAYLETERREHELTRHFSLARFEPGVIISLREKGVCEFELPEMIFDLDHPGHYHRRIKSVSVTIPAVVGPYSGVHAKLTLLSSQIRTNPSPGDEYANGQSGFVYDVTPAQSIVTSSGQSDSGMFQLDFRSDKVMPFEGAGAISRWRLELDPIAQSFDTRTITDVVLHMQYTARDGGAVLERAARESLFHEPRTVERHYLVSLAQSAPDALHAFRTSTGTESRELSLPVLHSLTGYTPRGLRGRLSTVGAILVMRSFDATIQAGVSVTLSVGAPDPEGTLLPDSPEDLHSELGDDPGGMPLKPSALFFFSHEEHEGLESYFDAEDVRATFKPATGDFSDDPLTGLADVLLIITEVLEVED